MKRTARPARVGGEVGVLCIQVKVLMQNNLYRSLTGLVLSVSAVTLQAASVDDVLPRYQTRTIALPKSAGYLTTDGAVKVTGYNDMREMLEAMTPIFTKAHPGISRISL